MGTSTMIRGAPQASVGQKKEGEIESCVSACVCVNFCSWDSGESERKDLLHQIIQFVYTFSPDSVFHHRSCPKREGGRGGTGEGWRETQG
jgi:hypothetical protein